MLDILAQRKKDFIKGNIYYRDLDIEKLGKTGDLHTGDVTKDNEKKIATAHTGTAKTIMLAMSKNRDH